MTTRTDLLPCPFCGGEASAIEDTSHSTAFEVGCFNGNCALEPYIWAEYKTVAVAAWNTRAADRIEALKGTVRHYAEMVDDINDELVAERSKVARLEEQQDRLGHQCAGLAQAGMKAEAALDAERAKVAKLVEALEECQTEIDEYSRKEYPLDHPVHDRYRQRDYAANPARIALAEIREDKNDD